MLRATAATSVLALAPTISAACVTTDPVVTLGIEHDALFREVARCDMIDEEMDAACKRWFACIARVAATPATTHAGVVVKLRIVQYDFEAGDTSHTDNLLCGAIADLERLGRSV